MPQHEWSVWRMSRAQWFDFVLSAGPHMCALLAVTFRRTLMWFKRASDAVKDRYKDAVDFFRWLFEKLLRLASSHAASVQAIAKAFVRDASDDTAFPVEFIGADAIAFAVDGSAAFSGVEDAIATHLEAEAALVDTLGPVEDANVNGSANGTQPVVIVAPTEPVTSSTLLARATTSLAIRMLRIRPTPSAFAMYGGVLPRPSFFDSLPTTTVVTAWEVTSPTTTFAPITAVPG